jgi:hypothetical protein
VKKMCYGSDKGHMMFGMHCGRHFLTKEEKINHLEEYTKWLENETNGVKEVIQELKKTS